MGSYDTLIWKDSESDEQYAQVKCWESTFQLYKIGDKVPQLNNHNNYAIMLREGGAAIILNRTLQRFINQEETENLQATDNFPIFDKWGNFWTKEIQNKSPIALTLEEMTGKSIDDSYFFEKVVTGR